MAKIPNIKLVIKNGDARTAEVTDLDTGEPIECISAIRLNINANADPFVQVELVTFMDFEYEGPAELVFEPLDLGEVSADACN